MTGVNVFQTISDKIVGSPRAILGHFAPPPPLNVGCKNPIFKLPWHMFYTLTNYFNIDWGGGGKVYCQILITLILSSI